MIEIIKTKTNTGYEFIHGEYETLARIPNNATNGDIIKALFPDSPRIHEFIQNNFYTWWHTDIECYESWIAKESEK